MKPLPLLLTLVTLALVGAMVLLLNKPSASDQEQAADPTAPPAPLPIDYEEPVPPLVQAPLIEESFVPDEQLISFVENFLGLPFETPPVFTPVPAEVIIVTVESSLDAALQGQNLETLTATAHALGVLPDYQQLKHNLVPIIAGEVRGLVTPKHNLVINNFASSSPPEQAALVSLLAQRLAMQELPFPEARSSVDEMLARHFAIQTIAKATENEFRKTLPAYPPSMEENLRESILLGLPAFFHELSTFAEFHLVEKLETSTPPDALERFADLGTTPSCSLLSFPFQASSKTKETTLGAIPLYVILLQSTDPTTARTLANALIGDQITIQGGILSWVLEFSSQKVPPRAAEHFRSYYSLRDSEGKVRIEVNESQLIIEVQQKNPEEDSIQPGFQIPIFDPNAPARPLE